MWGKCREISYSSLYQKSVLYNEDNILIYASQEIITEHTYLIKHHMLISH